MIGVGTSAVGRSGGSPRLCSACEVAIAPQAEFYATLRSAEIPAEDARMEEVSALFERHDFCGSCYESGAAEPTFAYWKSVMDAPTREPRKIVNLAALLVYFQHLGPSDDSPQEPTTEQEDQFEAEDRAREREAVLAALPQMEDTDAELMRYLLALFLIRKRVLRWVSAEDGVLTVEEAKSKVAHTVTEPRLSATELQESVEAFDELFR